MNSYVYQGHSRWKGKKGMKEIFYDLRRKKRCSGYIDGLH